MKKGIIVGILLSLCLLLTGCGNKYEGYWCKYSETATVVVLLEDDITSEEKTKLENVFNGYDNLLAFSFFDKESYKDIIGDDAAEIYDSYFVSFNSTDGVGTYIDELQKMGGVKEASQNSAKTNFELYHLDKKKKYTFSNSDEALESDIVKGTYKIKKGVITFTPEGEDKTNSMLYIKGEHLCGNPECTIVFAKSNSTCSSNNDK